MSKIAPLIFSGMALALAACGAGSGTPAVQQIKMQATEFKFEPTSIQVTAGSPVVITLANNGGLDHEWSIPKIPATGVKKPTKVLEEL